MSDFGFVGAAYQAASITQDDQACINWYPEIDPTKRAASEKAPAERGVIALYPTPGLLTRLELSGEIRGLWPIPGGEELLVLAADNLYTVDTDYTATLRGTIPTTSGIVKFTDNGISAFLTTGADRYYYTWGTTTFGSSTDGAFTGGDICDEVDNFIIYNRPDTNQWGCTNVSSIVSGALNLGSVLGSSGNLVALVVDKRQVLLLGEKYSERWIDVGTSPFPFAIIPGSSIQHGCAAKFSVAYLGESVAFLARDTRGQSTVIMWGASQTTPARISTFAIENAIQSYEVTSDAIAYAYSQAGHEFYVLTFPTQSVTWVYDLATQLWHQRAWRNPNNGVYYRHRSNCCAVFNGEIIVGDYQNGKIYALSQSTYTDDGDPLPVLRRCRHLTSDLNRQFFSDLQIQFQPGVGLQSGQGSDPSFILRWSDDGGFTWGNDHLVKIGMAGRYKHRAIKRRLGWSRDRIYEVEMTDPVYRVVVSANLNASAGSN